MKRSTKRRAEVRTCARAGCGGLFEWTPRDGQQQRYCTAACRQRAYRKRHCVPAGAEGPAADQATPAGGPGALTPFARRLSEAIRSSGLTLRQVQDGVAAGGGYVAASTLSTWQTGCGSPRGEDGFRRVLALERFLGTDPGDLTEPWRQSEPEPARPAAVQTPVPRGPRSPRRRPAGSGVAALTKDRRAWLEDAIAIAGGHASRTGLILTAQDHHYVVGPDRRPRMSRVLLEACAFKPDISSYWFPYTRHQHETTTFVPADNCGLGRTIHEQQYRSGSIDDAEIFAATEIVFDHPLELYTPYRFAPDQQSERAQPHRRDQLSAVRAARSARAVHLAEGPLRRRTGLRRDHRGALRRPDRHQPTTRWLRLALELVDRPRLARRQAGRPHRAGRRPARAVAGQQPPDPPAVEAGVMTTAPAPDGTSSGPDDRSQSTIRINLNITIPPRLAWTLTGSLAGGGIVQLIHQVLLHR